MILNIKKSIILPINQAFRAKKTLKKELKMKVFGYVRVSTSKQAKHGESIQTQISQIKAYSKAKGLKIAAENIYKDTVSGSTRIIERTEGAKLLDSLQEGDTVIATKLDRAFRNTADALNTLNLLKEKGVQIHLIDLGGEVTEGIGKVIFTVLAAFANFERERIASRIKEVKQKQIQDGKFTGGSVKFGFKLENKKLVKNPDEQKLIRKARKLKKEGLGSRRISSYLEKRYGINLSHTTVASLAS